MDFLACSSQVLVASRSFYGEGQSMHILHHYKRTRSHVHQIVTEVFPNEWVFQSSAFFHESTELGVSPMAKKGASQLRSTCVLRNSMKVIKKPWMAHFCCCLRFWALKASIHHSLYGQQTEYEWRKMVSTMICPMSCKKRGSFSWKVWAQDPYMSKRQSAGDKHLGNTKARTQSFTMTQSANLSGVCLKRGRIVYSSCRMEKKRKIANQTHWKTGAGNLHFQTCWHKLGQDSVFKETCHRWEGMLTKARFSYCTL